MKKIGLVLLACMVFNGCTHLTSVSSSSFPKASERTRPVSTQVKRMIFLGFNFNNDYVNNIAFNLANQCPNGKVQGVVTKHETVLYFAPFVYEVRVTANGYCTKG